MDFASVLRRRTPEPLPPDRTPGDGAGTFDLIPVPAVVAVLEDGSVRLEDANRAFGRARLAGASGLNETIGAFLRTGQSHAEQPWEAGNWVERRHYSLVFARVPDRGGPAALVTFMDRTAERRTGDTLRREMSTDSLTGLPNRTGFGDAVEQVADAGDRRWAVLTIDLERFSRINACLGSMAGDELLITVARRIKGALRAHDVLARTGGDEFGILLSVDESDDEADQVARRVRAALATPFRLSDYEIRLSCAIGVAAGHGTAERSEEVIRHAQLAMKRSKASGETEAYHARTLHFARAELAMETALRRAIDRDELTLVYQPIWDLETGRVESFEALTRWTDEDGTVHEPSRFIPVAEQSRLIVPLGRWAIDAATRTLAEWDRRAGGTCGVAVSVNVSPIQLQRDDVPQAVERALAASGLVGERLKLEVTESALIADPDRVALVLMALKGLGARIAMDDFGTGFSNLAALQRLPIDVLKIDRSFVTGMLADRDKVAIVRAILGLSQALNMTTIAEGIETPDVAQTLAALGCGFGQGYALARPLPAEDAYAFLCARNS